MSYLLWHTINDISTNCLSINDEQRSDVTKLEFGYDYHLRTPESAMPLTLYLGWPYSSWVGGQSAVLGANNSDRAPFESINASIGGMSRQSFVMGQVTDPNGNLLGLCVVDLYLTSTAAFVSGGTTDINGYYMLPTPFAAQNHFIYCNYNNGQYVGASVNTLTPNF